MRRLHEFLFIACLFLLWPFTSQAAEYNGQTELHSFNIEQAKQQLGTISSQLDEEEVDINSLNQSIEQMKKLASEAQNCIQDTTAKVNALETQMKQYFGNAKNTQKNVDADYLNTQKAALNKTLAKCRLFKIQTDETIAAFQSRLLSLQQEITFTRGKNIVQRFAAFPADWQALKLPAIEQRDFISISTMMFYLLPLLLLAAAISWRAGSLMHKKWRKKTSVLSLNALLIFAVFFFLSFFFVLSNPFVEPANNALFQNILLDFTFFAFSLFIYHFLFLLRRLPSLLGKYGFNVLFLKRLGLAVIVLYFSREIGLELLTLFQASTNLHRLYENIILFLSLSAMLYFTYSFYKSHRQLFAHVKHQTLAYQLIGFIALFLLMLALVGYGILAVKIAYFLFTFLLITTLGTLLLMGINKFFHLINYTPSYRNRLQRLFGYASEPPFFELTLIKFIFQLMMILALLHLLAEIIDDVRYFIHSFFDYLIDGFHIGSLHIIPLQWIIGLFIFALFILASRHIATRISRSQQFEEDEEEKQVAMASIMLYAGFAISVVIGLILAGFSFTSLTIIAGALSVGIGLGMQSIVNNFISGLILLIEKPIKAGDRIKVDDVEGFVKKVRVRSTQIVTPSHEDIIIPNSDLITHQVTNYMYHDKSWRVKCEVGVAYGSDVDLVQDLLLQVAHAHPEVEKKHNKKPLAYFCSFGDSALIFQLWCLIKDVNNKYSVNSDLNFAIDKIFREHDIEIAFPQRDVHIKFDPQQVPWNKDKDEGKDEA